MFDTTRRRRETSPASEIQQNLLPPRIARIAGGTLAGNVLPSYDIGGDWFDYAENADGAWIGVADSKGSGTAAAALGAVALGAFRAKRRADCSPRGGGPGDPHRHRRDPHGGGVRQRRAGPLARPVGHLQLDHLRPPGAASHQRPGRAPPARRRSAPRARTGRRPHFQVEARRLEAGERLLLLSDGVLARPTRRNRPFGLAGVRAAVARSGPGAAATVRALEDAIAGASSEPLEDDATIVVFAPSAPVE